MEMQQLTIAADQQRWIAAPKAESTAAAEKDHCDTPEVDLCWGTLAREVPPYLRESDERSLKAGMLPPLHLRPHLRAA
eukprot:1481631-Pyramimonas_sp.AAC.2